MRVWVASGVTVALVAGGAAGGYLLRPSEEPEVVSYGGPRPVAAESPSYPAEPLPVLDDPEFPALRPGLELHRTAVGDKPFDLRLQVPVGWSRSIPTPGEWRWYPPPRLVFNTYFLRVRLIANQYQPIPTMLDSRINALDGAEGVKDFVVESRTRAGFVADYVSEGHRRVAMEVYVPQAPDGAVAFAWIALVGREADRAGMEDLLARIVDSARPGPDYR